MGKQKRRQEAFLGALEALWEGRRGVRKPSWGPWIGAWRLSRPSRPPRGLLAGHRKGPGPGSLVFYGVSEAVANYRNSRALLQVKSKMHLSGKAFD